MIGNSLRLKLMLCLLETKHHFNILSYKFME